jgi:hypothetical protein
MRAGLGVKAGREGWREEGGVMSIRRLRVGFEGGLIDDGWREG